MYTVCPYGHQLCSDRVRSEKCIIGQCPCVGIVKWTHANLDGRAYCASRPHGIKTQGTIVLWTIADQTVTAQYMTVNNGERS